jgi:hypothetical protein
MGPARKLTYSKGMSFGFPARWAVVCAIAFASGAAHGQDIPDRRKVAVIDLSGDPAAHALRTALYDQLQIHWALRSLGDATLDAALEGDFVDEDGAHFADAMRAKATADDQLLNLQFEQAIESAEAGMRLLTDVTPSKAAALAADLAFEIGSAELSRKRAKAAIQWFSLVHHLDPGRRLDPVQFDPDTVNAYKKAEAASPVLHKLEVRGTGTVWIDGSIVGSPPGSPIEVSDGPHLVQLAGPARQVRGHLLAQGEQTTEIEDAPASQVLLLRRARLGLKETPDDAVARASPMKHLAELLDVHDAVLIWESSDGKLRVQTWRDRAPGFSALREHAEDDPSLPLLKPLAPPKPPDLVVHTTFTPPPFTPPPRVEAEPPWYRKTWVQATVAGGVVAAVIGGIVWARHTSNVTFSGNTQWQGMTP